MGLMDKGSISNQPTTTQPTLGGYGVWYAHIPTLQKSMLHLYASLSPINTWHQLNGNEFPLFSWKQITTNK